ncbi:flagellar assembly protein FliH [Bordetella genomosp. 13]|uniref:flagellar assembly protein FliH n=1 Tax=Bordetella genomosp. 13 TaxID=463040 RepID=UPI0011A43AD0|nr:flagellar assembly protein FliH [Bordetella genomosp. 13]
MSDRGPVGSTLSRRAAWQRWQMASFDEPQVEEAPAEPVPAPDPGPDPEEVRQALREQARSEGHMQGMAEGHRQGLAEGREQGHQEGLAAGREEGYAEGLAQGREQGNVEAAHLNTLVGNLATSLRGIEEQLGQSLITLALDIAAQVVRQQLAEQPQAMLAAVREVLHINPTPPQGALRLWIHPEDLELVRLHLADELKEGNWRVLADESITRGGCRAETPYGDIDATLQTRWRRVAASLGRSASWDEQP